MTETTGRPSTRLEPYTAWTVVTDSPLKGLSFAREAGTILAWDDGNQLYLLNLKGESLSFSRVPNRINSATISDDGSLIALLVEPEDSGLVFLNADFEVEHERAAPADATFVTIDPHGRYLAVGTRQTTLHFFSRYRPPGGNPRDDALALASLLRCPGGPWPSPPRPSARSSASLLSREPGPARPRDHLAGPLALECRPARRRWRRRHDPGKLLYPGNPAIRPEGPQRRLISLGRHRLACRARFPRPHNRHRNPGKRARSHQLGRQRSLAHCACRVRSSHSKSIRSAHTCIYGHSTGEIVRLDLFGGNRRPPGLRRACPSRRGLRPIKRQRRRLGAQPRLVHSGCRDRAASRNRGDGGR